MAPPEPSDPGTPDPRLDGGGGNDDDHRADGLGGTSPAAHQQERDPTGVRALLAGLPDPGPMPQDLVRRIEARLEVEQAHQAAERANHSPAASGALTEHADRVVHLATERTRRRPARTLAILGAAAAGLAVTTITLTQFLDDGDSPGVGTAAQYPAGESTESGADGAAPAEAPSGGSIDSDTGSERGSAGAADDARSPEALGDQAADRDLGALASVQVRVLPELGRVGDATYAERILEHSREHATLGTPALTPVQAQSCWDNMPEAQWDTHYAASATYAPRNAAVRDVVVLLGINETGVARAWMLPEDCISTSDVEPLDATGALLEAP